MNVFRETLVIAALNNATAAVSSPRHPVSYSCTAEVRCIEVLLPEGQDVSPR